MLNFSVGLILYHLRKGTVLFLFIYFYFIYLFFMPTFFILIVVTGRHTDNFLSDRGNKRQISMQ